VSHHLLIIYVGISVEAPDKIRWTYHPEFTRRRPAPAPCHDSGADDEQDAPVDYEGVSRSAD